MEENKSKKKKTTEAKKNVKEVSKNDKKETKKTVVKEEKKEKVEKEKVEVEKEKKEEKEERVTTPNKKNTSFNLVEVIIIMIITSIFGILIGSCATYFKDNVIDQNSVPYEFDEFMEVYRELSDEYYGDIDKSKMAEAGIKAMLGYLGDDYTTYMDSVAYQDFQDELNGEFFGMGVTITLDENENIYILEVLKDSPAEKAGFQVNDILKAVDGTSVEKMSMDEVSNLIKGKENTEVKIKVLRNGEEKELTFVRGKVEITSVTHEVIADTNIGYINISIFAKNTPKQFKEAMDDLVSKNVDSVIIDVRSNSGGYSESAQEMAALFLDKNSVIYQLDTKGSIEKIKTTKDKVYDTKVAILVNEASASASELFAASLNDNLDAPLIGRRTYGKGTVQKTKKLASGAMIKYTIQEWYTPNGNRVNFVGLIPTEEVIMNPNYYVDPTPANDNQLAKAIEILNK